MSASHFLQGPDVGSVINTAWLDGVLASMPGKYKIYLYMVYSRRNLETDYERERKEVIRPDMKFL